MEQVTEAYKSECNHENKEDNDSEHNETEQNHINNFIMEMAIPDMNDHTETIEVNPGTETSHLPTNFSLNNLRDKGAYGCGYQQLHSRNQGDIDSIFVEIEVDETENTKNKKHNNLNVLTDKTVTLDRMVKVMVSSVIRKVGDDSAFDFKPASVCNTETVIDDVFKQTIPNYSGIEATGTCESLKQWANEKGFDKNQKKAFFLMLSHFIITYIEEIEEHSLDSTLSSTSHYSIIRKEKGKLFKLGGKRTKLRMFLDGAGGSGKSAVIHEVLKYARMFCYNLEVPFTKYTILVTASTGAAAILIKGNTVHSACSLYKKIITEEEREQFKHVRLLIVDEISMIDKIILKRLDRKLRDLCDISEFYGGLNIIFVGDFRQLDPINSQNAIYKDTQLPQWMIAINTYVECTGMYRFKDDPEWGQILSRFRNGVPVHDDFQKINERVLRFDGHTKDGDDVPDNISYVTPNNKERDAINAGLFSTVLKKNPKNELLL